MIWLNLLIPIFAIVLMLVKFKRKVVLWEYAVLLVVPIILITIAKMISVGAQTKDVEALQFQITNATYYEAWSSWVDKTCSRQVSTGTDSKGNTTYRTEYYDCSYCDDNGPRWVATDNAGNTYSVSSAQFEEYASEWEKRLFVDKNRNIKFHGGCGEDGDAYTTNWNNVFETIEPVTKKHNYKNVLQASNSVYTFDHVDSLTKAELDLFEYPNINRWNYNPLMGSNNVVARERLQKWNAKMGSWKQVNMLIAVYHKQPIEAAYQQENYWEGGNKNEVILCIGLDESNKVDWTYVISWTETDIMKINLNEQISKMDYQNMPAIVDTMANTINKYYQRKQFADFDYIKVQPTLRATIITFILTLLVTIGLSYYVVLNEQTF